MNRRMAEAWRRHSEVSGHLDGIAEHNVAYCLQCRWVFAEGAAADENAITLRSCDDGYADGASTWARDLDTQAMVFRD